MPHIKLAHWPAPISVGRGTILETALAAGVPFPHGCMSGECGTCKCHLAAGEVVHDSHSPDALSESEHRAGFILACRARPRGDIELKCVTPQDPMLAFPVRRIRARVVRKSAATHDVTRLRLEVLDSPLAFAAGQFAKLKIADLPPRSYSMANHPHEALLEFHIRRAPEGVVSNYVANALRVGDEVKLEGPFGTACWHAPRPGPLLLVGGGTGLAPLKSVLAEALIARQSPIYLYHGVRDERDLYDSDELTRLAVQGHIHYVPVLSDPSTPTTRRAGFVHCAIGEDFRSLGEFQLFIAGPPPMVEAMRALALTLGAAPNDIAADPFHHTDPDLGGLLARLRGWLGGRVTASAAISQSRA